MFRSTYVVNRRGQTTDVLSHYIKKGNGNVLGLRTAVGYQYNEVGQRTKVTREDGHYWKYSYNDRGEVISAKKHEPTGNQPLGGLQYEYQYDDIGNRTEMKYGGDKNGGNLRTVDYQTNGHNQYTQISHPGYHHVTGLAGLTGQPPAIGTVKVNTSQVTANEFQGSFFYKEFQESHTSNPVSVPISIEETPSQGKKMTQTLGDVYVPKEDVVPQYQNGNLINDGRWIYLWSANNRLRRMEPTPEAIAAHSAAGHTTDLPILDFLYDWKGRRISKKVTYGTAFNSPFTITSYVYDGWNIVAAIDRTYNDLDLKIVRSIWGLDLSGGFQGAGGVGGLLATRTTDSIYDDPLNLSYTTTEVERHFPSYDGNGNIIAWTTDIGGTTTTRDFDAFGNVVTNQGLRWSASTPYGFSTKCEDAETGLYYYGYRYYDPVTGRWPSRDPIGERGGINLYGMVGNDTVNLLDYLGLLNIKPSKSTWGLGVYDFSDLTGQRMEIPLDGKSSKKRYENLAEIRKRASMVSEDSLNMAGFKGAKLSHEAMMRGPRVGTQKRGFRQMVEYGGRVCCNSETNKYTITGPYTSGDNNHLDDFGAYHPSSLEGDDRYVVLPPNIDDALPGRMSEIYPEVEVTEADQEGKLVTYLVGSSGNLVRDFGAEGELAAAKKDTITVVLKAPKASG